MQSKYEELGLPVKLIVEPGGGHSYWPGIVAEYKEDWKWFNFTLGCFGATPSGLKITTALSGSQ